MDKKTPAKESPNKTPAGKNAGQEKRMPNRDSEASRNKEPNRPGGGKTRPS